MPICGLSGLQTSEACGDCSVLAARACWEHPVGVGTYVRSTNLKSLFSPLYPCVPVVVNVDARKRNAVSAQHLLPIWCILVGVPLQKSVCTVDVLSWLPVLNVHDYVALAGDCHCGFSHLVIYSILAAVPCPDSPSACSCPNAILTVASAKHSL